MEKKLRILIVEDVPTDAELIKHEIKKNNIEFNDIIVDTNKDYIDALNSFKPDIILSDYSLPHFDGMQALKIKQELVPLIPFILVTGSLNEETAVEVMKAGADDYILKEHISRLGQAIKLALEKKEFIESQKRAEEELLKSRALYKSIFKNTGTATILVDKNSIIIDANEESHAVTGYTREQLIGTSWTKYVAAESLDMMKKYFLKRQQNQQSDVPNRYETKLINATGDVRNAILSIGVISSSGIMVVSMLDITELRKSEEILIESEERNRLILENSFEAIYLLDKVSKLIIYANPSFLNITGYNSEEVKTLSIFDLVIEDRSSINSNIDQIISGKSFSMGERKWKKKDGTLVNIEVSASKFIQNEKIVVFISGRDITERKQAEKALQESELKFNTTFQYSPVAILLTSAENGKIIDANDLFLNYTGFMRNEVIDRTTIELGIYENDADREKMLNDFQKAGYLYGYELDVRMKNGVKLNCLVSINNISVDGKPCLLSTIIDITDRKRAEENLRRSEERFQLAARATKDIIYDWNLKKNEAWFSKRMKNCLDILKRMRNLKCGAKRFIRKTGIKHLQLQIP